MNNSNRIDSENVCARKGPCNAIECHEPMYSLAQRYGPSLCVSKGWNMQYKHIQSCVSHGQRIDIVCIERVRTIVDEAHIHTHTHRHTNRLKFCSRVLHMRNMQIWTLPNAIHFIYIRFYVYVNTSIAMSSHIYYRVLYSYTTTQCILVREYRCIALILSIVPFCSMYLCLNMFGMLLFIKQACFCIPFAALAAFCDILLRLEKNWL